MAATPAALTANARRLYDADPYTWAMTQAKALRDRTWEAVDWENVAEEIEAMGRSEERGWVHSCAEAMEHLLAIEHRREVPNEVLRKWRTEVMTFRGNMADKISENPGLKGKYASMFAQAWKRARRGSIARFVEYDCELGGDAGQKEFQRHWQRELARECPYALKDVAAFNPDHDEIPRWDIWPASTARVLNERLGSDYPVQPRSLDRGPSWSR